MGLVYLVILSQFVVLCCGTARRGSGCPGCVSALTTPLYRSGVVSTGSPLVRQATCNGWILWDAAGGN
ncbi:MAG: hypothetical protein P8M34_14700 [Saprospiraceae bacterium]|nr:hypothetical protein [Saprospiraceae bacterium]